MTKSPKVRMTKYLAERDPQPGPLKVLFIYLAIIAISFPLMAYVVLELEISR